jgi:hypothetical protein
MSEDRFRDDDLGELFQLFQVLADASDPIASEHCERSRCESPSHVPPLVSIEPITPASIHAKFLRHAQKDFQLSLRIADDIEDSDEVPFLAFVACLRGEELSQRMLNVFRLSSPSSDDGDSSPACRGDAMQMSHLSETLRRRTLAVANDSAGGSLMNSVRSGRRKGTLPSSRASNGEDPRGDAAHRAYVLLERLYSLLAAEISNQSGPVELVSTPWTEKHAGDTPEVKKSRRKTNRSIAKKVFPPQFRKKHYTLAEVEELIELYDRKTTASWGSSSTAQSPTTGRLSKRADNVKYIANSPLPKIENAFLAKSADDANWIHRRTRASSDAATPTNRSKSEASDSDFKDVGALPSVSAKTAQRYSLPELRGSPSSGRLSVVGFVEDSVEAASSPVRGVQEVSPLSSPVSRRAHSLPALKGTPASPLLSPEPRSSSKLAEVYHQKFPKIPANFKRKFHSDLSEKLYKHVRPTAFDKLTLTKPYFMPTDDKLEIRERFKVKGAVAAQEDIARIGFCYQSIPLIAAQALEGLEAASVARSLAAELAV